MSTKAGPNLTRDLEATQGDRFRCPFCAARRGLNFSPEMGDSGVWYCFACRRSGDGVDLFVELRNSDVSTALDAFGIERSSKRAGIKKKARRAPRPERSLTDEEWKRRGRLYMHMTAQELMVLDALRRRRTEASEQRDRSQFETWERLEARLFDLVEHRIEPTSS